MFNEKKDSGRIKGGFEMSTVNINGKSYNCKTVRDANGNIVYEGVTPKFLGIF